MDKAVATEQTVTRRRETERQLADVRALRQLLADQLAPIRDLDTRIARRLGEPVNVEGARERIALGRVAFDPRVVIACAGDLVGFFVEATAALEDAGLISNEAAAGARRQSQSVYLLLGSWVSGELRFHDEITAVSRYAASLVGRAVLRQASMAVRRSTGMLPWDHAFCPCCGGAPDLAFVTRKDARALVCVRCDTLWSGAPRGCLGCGATGAPSIARIPTGELGYTIFVCNACSRYIKEGPEASPDMLLVERTILVPVDAAAKRRGLRF
ncbi:MAG: formate dehydrogenase accessory protein FdhE [Gemmatimonadota bacterium]|nr:formate dehydrogenase accessory protein FdhE [Gemmatimonadota bacterium]